MLRIVTHIGRQEYLIGTLVINRSLNDFASYLVSSGYSNHFVAWKDDGEIVSLRKTIGFTHQYHIRVFSDGEIRAHYELTPEYRPFAHLWEVGVEERRDVFVKLLGEWVT